jgi:hypothetical protein
MNSEAPKKKKSPTFRELQKQFWDLSLREKEQFLKDIYNFSPDMKLFWRNRFADVGESGADFLEKMEKETYGKIKIRRRIRLKNLNDIHSKAQKSYVQGPAQIQLSRVAYRGLCEWMQTFGYFPQGYLRAAAKHLGYFIHHVQNYVRERSAQDDLFLEEKKFLEELYTRDFYGGEIQDIFQSQTGLTLEYRRSYLYW